MRKKAKNKQKKSKAKKTREKKGQKSRTNFKEIFTTGI